MSINRPELIDIIAKKGNISKSVASENLKLVLESISDVLEQGNDLTIKGFGTFKITELAARTGRNPQTGEKMQIKAKNVVRFKASTNLSEKVRKPRGKEADGFVGFK